MLLLVGCGRDQGVTETTSDSATAGPSASALAPTTTTSAAEAAPSAAAPGDSPGEWVEVALPGALAAGSLSVSEEALIVETSTEDLAQIHAYLFASGEILELPVEASAAGGSDIDGQLAVWWEAAFDEASSSWRDERVYAYQLPGGPKVEVAGLGGAASFPQVRGDFVTWVEPVPWEANPEEFRRVPIFGVRVDEGGKAVGSPQELVPSAVAFILGDSTWTYSLGAKHLAWEQATAAGGLQPGSYLLDLQTREVSPVGTDAWRPSLGDASLAFWSDGVQVLDLESARARVFDPEGDFPVAAPTFVAYFRGAEEGFEVVVRGLQGQHEQVLAVQLTPPWLSAPIAVSATRVAYVDDDGHPRLFEWHAE